MDHLVYATPNLAATVAWFQRTTGVAPARGGRHEGLGTANYLVGLGGRSYLEIIGPDLEQPDPDGPRPFAIDRLDQPTLLTWAIAVPNIDEAIAAARDVGVDPGDAHAMSRRTGTGDLLRWRLTPPSFATYDGLVPFLIDWGTSIHPTERDLPDVEQVEWSATHPSPESVRAGLAAVGAELAVTDGAVGLRAIIRGPSGDAHLG